MSHRLPPRTYLYFLSQSINLTTAVMSVTMAAIVGASLAPSPWYSTVPYGFQFLFVLLATLPASRLMARLGRRNTFLLATLPLAASGVSGFLAVEGGSFALLVLSHSLLGLYIAVANFNRFAATDGLDTRLKPRAISLVVAGGVLSALTGPMLANGLKNVAGFQTFAICYAAFAGLAALSLVIHLLVREAAPGPGARAMPAHRPIRHSLGLLRQPGIALAVLVAAIGYSMMNLLMIQASMHLSSGMHMEFSAISTAIQWHVLAMFAPSFFTGALISRLGLRNVLYGGVGLLLLSCLINLMAGPHYPMLVVALVVLGLGWNFTYVGGSALLTRILEGSPHAIEAQGVNDLGIAVMTTVGAFAPAFLMQWLGWPGTNLLCGLICLALLAACARGFRQEAVRLSAMPQ